MFPPHCPLLRVRCSVVDQLRPVQADEGVGVVAVGGLAENVALDDDVVGGCDGVASAAGVAVVFGDGSTEVAAVAVLFAAFAVHARPADEDTDGNLEEISHLQ